MHQASIKALKYTLHYTTHRGILFWAIKLQEILLKSTFQQNEGNICLPFLMLPKRGCN